MTPQTNEQPTKSIRQFQNGDHIPQVLKDTSRWALWEAVWNVKRCKFDKIPLSPRYLGRISTARPERWSGYDETVRAYLNNPQISTGIGYCMTVPHGLVGADLDRCIDEGGAIAPWAMEIVRQLNSYTEISPSGRGLRIFVQGTVDFDFTDHEVGIEVYGGHEARFLTVSGDWLEGTPKEVNPAPEAIAAICAKYGAARRAKAEVIDLAIPDLLDELAMPDISTLNLPASVNEFLSQGTHDGDRSKALHICGIELYSSGLDDDQVLSVLASNQNTWEVALDHRNQDADRALMYLWTQHCQKAKPKARPRTASLDDFDEIGPPATSVSSASAASRFRFKQAASYLQRKPVEWAIKNVLPKAELGAVYGESGAGKSFFALDLAMAIATGQPWRGHRVKQGRVLYICAEGASGFALRIKAYAEHHGLALSELPLFVLGDTPNFLEAQDIKDLVAAIRAVGPVDYVFVDTLAQVTAGANENTSEDMSVAIKHCQTIHRVVAAMVILIAHAGKDVSRGIRGWSGIKGALDVEILVERNGDNRVATIDKLKDGEGEGSRFPFKLETVTLDFDEDGDPVTSCVLTESATAKANLPAIPKNATWQQLVMRVAKELIDLAGDDVSTEQLTSATVAQIPKDGTTAKDRRRERVLKAITDLSASGHISIADGKVRVN